MYRLACRRQRGHKAQIAFVGLAAGSIDDLADEVAGVHAPPRNEGSPRVG
jgi:hypothetical protein